MPEVVYFLMVECLSKPLTQVEKVILETFQYLTKHGSHFLYPSNKRRIKLFLKNDLSKYSHIAYASESLIIKIGKKERRPSNRKLIDFPDIEYFLDEIGCMTVDGYKALNKAQHSVDKRVSEIIKDEYINRKNLLELELSILRSLRRSKKKQFTVREMSSRSGVRFHLENVQKGERYHKAEAIRMLLDKMVMRGDLKFKREKYHTV